MRLGEESAAAAERGNVLPARRAAEAPFKKSRRETFAVIVSFLECFVDAGAHPSLGLASGVNGVADVDGPRGDRADEVGQIIPGEGAGHDLCKLIGGERRGDYVHP